MSKSATGKAKKNDDLVGIEEENSFEFATDEVPVTKPGLLEKREKTSRGPRSRAVKSDEREYFDIE